MIATLGDGYNHDPRSRSHEFDGFDTHRGLADTQPQNKDTGAHEGELWNGTAPNYTYHGVTPIINQKSS
jgi:hypothetical protein